MKIYYETHLNLYWDILQCTYILKFYHSKHLRKTTLEFSKLLLLVLIWGAEEQYFIKYAVRCFARHWITTPLTGKPGNSFPIIQRQVLAGVKHEGFSACSQLQTTDTENAQNLCTSHSTNTDSNESSSLIEWYQKTPARPINTCSSTSVLQPLVELCPCSPWQRCAPPELWLWWLCAEGGGCAARAAASWSAHTAAGCAAGAVGSSGCESRPRGENLQRETEEVTELLSLLYLICNTKSLTFFPKQWI